MKSSTRAGVAGARNHKKIASNKPAESRILMFMLCLLLMECYIINSKERLALTILYVNILTITASNSERNERVFENIMD
jgi:hypothetical protein